jgi:hypothetical protein
MKFIFVMLMPTSRSRAFAFTMGEMGECTGVVITDCFASNREDMDADMVGVFSGSEYLFSRLSSFADTDDLFSVSFHTNPRSFWSSSSLRVTEVLCTKPRY